MIPPVAAAAFRTVETLESRILFATYTVTDLGVLTTDANRGAGINNAGQITTTIDASGNIRAVSRVGSTVTDLGTFGGPDSFAAGINTAGNIAGSALDGNIASRAFISINGTKTNLGTLGGGFSTAAAINDNNAVVGWSQDSNELGPEHAFVWLNGTMTDVGTLASIGADSSRAYGINGTGLVVGESAIQTGEFHAFRGTAGSLTDMGVLSGDNFSTARGVNDAGQIVGRSGKDTGVERAFLFNGTSMTNIGQLTDDQAAQANDINNSGVIVGYSANNVDLVDQRAFVYSAGSMQDLNGLIDAGSGWTLQEALSVNDSGAIVGYGLLNGGLHSFLLTPVGGGGGDAISPTVSIATPAPASGAATVTVTVTYTDETAMNAGSVDVGNIEVTRSGGGGALTVTGVTTTTSGDGKSVIANYTVAAPGGTWDSADDGAYTATLLSSKVTDVAGNAAATASQAFTVNFTSSSGPTATIGSVNNVTAAGGTSGTVTVTYTDSDNVSFASIDTGDITISGGGSASLPVTAVSASPASNGSPMTVTYTFTPPGGSFDAADNDTYTVALNTGQVLDTVGNPALGNSVQFTVDIPLEIPALDTTFNGGNPVAGGFVAEASTADLNGKIYVVGHSGDLGGSTSVGIIRRFNTDGSLDTTFGTAGQVTTPAVNNDAYYNIALDSTGKLLTVSGARGQDFLVARYTIKGKVQGSFGTKGAAVTDLGGTTEIAYGLATAPDGSIYAGGGTTAGLAILKLDKKGKAATFGTDGSLVVAAPGESAVSALALQSNGSIVAAGDFNGAVFALRVGADGVVDAGFNGGAPLAIAALAVRTDIGTVDRTIGLDVQADDKILIANRTTTGLFGVVRLDSAGALDTTFSGDGVATIDFGGDDDADSVLAQGTGEVILVGTTDAGGSPQTAVAALTSGGDLVTTFDTDGKFTAASGISDPATALLSGGNTIRAAGSLQANGSLITVTSSSSPTSGSGIRRMNLPGSNVVGQFGIVNGKTSKLVFTDNDGTLVMVSLKNATGTAFYNGTNVDLVVTGSTAASAATIRTKGGDGRARIGNVRSDGALGGFTASTSDVNGTMFVNGDLRKINLGTLSGTLATTNNIGTANFRNDLAGAMVLAGANLGADAAVGGSDDTYAAATITKFAVAGTVAASVVGAGFDPVDGQFLNGGAVVGGTASVIRVITVRRVVDGASRFFAGAFGSIKVPQKVEPGTDVRFQML